MPDLLKPSKHQPKESTGKSSFNPDIYKRSEQSGDSPITQKKPKQHSRLLLWSSLSLVLVVLLIGGAFLTRVVMAVNSTNSETGEKVGLIDQIRHLIANPEKQLRGEADDRINILLTGIGGAGHQGAYLADTIILVSIKPSTDEVATMSIPRDLYVEIPDYGYRKINNALAFGVQSDYPGGADELLATVVEQTFDITIDYYARVDFEGFRKAIDDLDGVDINVDNAFTDYQYPDYNYGYQVISFKEGTQTMDGERALQYVRSRHGNNGEGSDFARSQRQQKVLLAVKDKFFSVNNLINPSNIISALDSLGQHNQTNMEIWEIARLAKMVENITADDIVTITLDTSPDGMLYADHTLDGAYILRPEGEDFSEIQYKLANVFNTSFIVRENARIEIQNSTSETGLATQTADELEAQDFNIVHIGNANADDALTQTTIYDLSDGGKPYTVVSLKNLLNAKVAPAATATSNQVTPPVNGEDIDILIIIGSDFLDAAQLTHLSNS